MPEFEAFTVVYLMLVIVLPLVLLGLFIGTVAWTLRSRDPENDRSLSTSPNLEE